ncbi:hypothetical protein [Streptacidiphilus fuscans]|uniref:Uncharacterized protein n=1 Tax=Streptacidiphilus fuscans TaxID=2789292 RepID=A0A931B624_9ACTN|nr:hypothetical protein [Streptacidiphilus fuscans]MBF9071890.1 hypothetical protein [Streptacidiphilus fuscans]
MYDLGFEHALRSSVAPEGDRHHHARSWRIGSVVLRSSIAAKGDVTAWSLGRQYRTLLLRSSGNLEGDRYAA